MWDLLSATILNYILVLVFRGTLTARLTTRRRIVFVSF
jgi:hypothetical protein